MLNDFLSILFPNLCVCCNEALLKNEHLICVNCRAELPRTKFHEQQDNLVQKKFWGRVDLEMATAFLYFDKAGKVQHAIHELKYNNNPEVGEMLGKLFAAELSGIFQWQFDAVVPVPLHPAKKKKRGYNQSYHFALGISEALKIPVFEDAVHRAVFTESQTKKGRYERWENVEKVFQIKDHSLVKNKHLLLVDDVITTGATIEACAQHLVSSGAKVSVAAIALAH